MALSAAAAASAFISGCGYGLGDPASVRQPPVVPQKAVAELYAGVGEVDITPPPGFPSYGHSSNGASHTTGYWLRLKARIVALQHAESRVALVQLDLGAASLLLHRRIAAQLADIGIGPENLMTATTHTHGGPGGLFSNQFYNEMVGARPAFDPRFVDWLAQRIANGIRGAFASLAPARAGVAQAGVGPSFTHNRSEAAWRENFSAEGLPPPKEDVDRKITVLRVDRRDADGTYRPAAAWSVFAVHGTTMLADYPAMHGDVHGLAARLTQNWVQRRHGVRGFVAATANGAEGDVSAVRSTKEQGKATTMRVAGDVARAAGVAFASLDQKLSSDFPVRTAYRELSMRGAGTSRGRLCQTPVLGAPQAAGSEEGRGPLYGFLQMEEGAVRRPSGCDATKVKIGGPFQDGFFEPDEFPDVVPFQVVALGKPESGVVLAAVPGEPTTEVGREVVRDVQRTSAFATVAVVGLANGYATYFTLPGEFLAQHYEGGATIYGPYQGIFAAEQLARLAGSLGTAPRKEGAVPPTRVVDYPPQRTFFPGETRGLLPAGQCDPGRWAAGDLESDPDASRPTRVFSWTGFGDGELCELPSVRILCGGAVLEDEQGYPQTDEGFDIEVRRSGDTWRARWTVAGRSSAPCRFEVARPPPLSPIVSATFTVGAP